MDGQRNGGYNGIKGQNDVAPSAPWIEELSIYSWRLGDNRGAIFRSVRCLYNNARHRKRVEERNKQNNRAHKDVSEV